MDISFYCDKCGLHILVPEEGKGMGAKCPSCGADLIVPEVSAPKRESPAAPASPVPQGSSSLPWLVAGIALVFLIAAAALLYSARTKADTLQDDANRLRKSGVGLNTHIAEIEQLKTQLQAELDKATNRLKELESSRQQLSQEKADVEKRLAETAQLKTQTEQLKTQTEADLEKSRQELKDIAATADRLRTDKADLEKRLAQADQLRVAAEADLLKATTKVADLQTENAQLRAKVPPAPAK